MKRVSSDRLLFLFLVFLLALGIFARVYRIGAVPVGLYWDEAAILADAVSLSQTGKDIHGNSGFHALFLSYGDYKLPLYIWLTSLVVWIAGASSFAVRFISLLSGVISIFASGYLATLLIPTKTKRLQSMLFVTVACTVALSPWSFLFSRTGFEAHLGMLLMLLSVISSIKWRSLYGASAAALLGAAAVYSYFSVRFVWPAVFISSVLLLYPLNLKLFFRKPTKVLKNIVGVILLPGILFSLLLVPLYQSNMYAPSQSMRLSTASVLSIEPYALESNLFREIAGNSFLDRLLFHRYFFQLHDLATQFVTHLNPQFMFLYGDANLRHSTGAHGLFLAPFMIFFLLGLVQLYKRHPQIAVFLTLWWFAALIPASVPREVPHALRSINALPALAIIIGYGWYWIWSVLKKKTIVLAAVLLIILVCFAQFLAHYFWVYPFESAKDWQAGYREVSMAIETAQEQSDAKQVVIIPFDDRFFLHLIASGTVDITTTQQYLANVERPSQLGSISFEVPNSSSLTEYEKPVIIVGEKSVLKDLLVSEDQNTVWTDVQSPYSDTTYSVVIYDS